jgi:hypothetical protein
MSWLSPLSPEMHDKCIGKLVGTLRELGGPMTAQVCDLIEAGRYLDVVNFKFDYDNPELSYDDCVYARQAQALLQKQENLAIEGIDKEEVAWDKFKQSEAQCLETNKRFQALDQGEITYPPGVASILFYAQRKISEVLGPLPDLGQLDYAFGPGANTSVKADRACARLKLSASLECSTNFAPFVRSFLMEFPIWAAGHANSGVVVDELKLATIPVKATCGKLMFVPKDARSHRSIVVEPLLNSLYQKGVGSYLKTRLKRFGVDLTDQTRNRELSRKGSVDGASCTIDLSSASDTVSRELVWNLLPLQWAHALDIGRTPQVTYRSETLLLEKFSSMGNAYTFELESLIFYSLAVGTCTALGLSVQDVSVFGDDIILPVNAYHTFVGILDFCGFTVNSEKSFVHGPFRESCGFDYLNGMGVRPFYLKKRLNDRVLFVMHNFFVRNGEWRLAKVVKTFIKPHNRIYGPDGYGDGHLLGSYTLRSSRKLRRLGYEGGFFDTFVSNSRRVITRYANDWVFPSYSVYIRSGAADPTDPDIVRGSRGYRRASIYTLARRVFAPSL